MSTTNPPKKDHWTAQAYNSTAAFVPKLTTTVTSYLDPQPSDRILDIGCGDGELTSQISTRLDASQGGSILGVDSSISFIQTAKERYPHIPFLLHDATLLDTCKDLSPSSSSREGGPWDKIFSNAAMHWILRPPQTRRKFFESCHSLLRPSGTLVFEQGGHGNVSEILTASIAALTHHGVPLETAREASPWFFPSKDWMRRMLEETGFEVVELETEYRPSRVEDVEGWVRLMCAEFLEFAPEGTKESVVREICELVDAAITREEDGSTWLGYLRLRGVARKK
ncbi:Hypothetical predicted protein [Lecanosticta acicola]|uniref:Methyltransferase type 12 domain-containing protein n=1 Tax=Lecanosticta acicola TaxID=111012 RepID=A0AAI8Z6J2_9PEZI|nr:Hypothetical predicted protein [Lecanosticta acicola]